MIGEASGPGPVAAAGREGATAGLLTVLADAAVAEGLFLSEVREFYAGDEDGGFALAFDICWPRRIDDAELPLLPRAGAAGAPVRRLSLAGDGMPTAFDRVSFERRHLARQIGLAQAVASCIHSRLATGHAAAASDDRAFLLRQVCRASLLQRGFSEGGLSPAPAFHGLERLSDDLAAWTARSDRLAEAEVLALVALRRRSGRASRLLGRVDR